MYMYIMYFFLHLLPGQVSVSISDTDLTGVAGQDVPVSCFVTLGIGVDLVSNGSVTAPNFTKLFENRTQTNYILRNVSRQNNNAQLYCLYATASVTSAIATLSVWCELLFYLCVNYMYIYNLPQYKCIQDIAMLEYLHSF